MARSHRDKLIAALRSQPHERASFARLAAILGDGWTVEKVEAKARQFDADDDIPIHVVRGAVQYFRADLGKKPGPYKAVRTGIEKRWGRDNGMRRIQVEHTSRTALKRAGKWTQPDLVARVDRRSDASPEVVFLAIEVEQPGGFDVVSVYQAYEFGRGADFSWVFYTGRAASDATMRQVRTAAEDLGVGIVHAARPTAPAAWETIIKARQRERTTEQQHDFFRRAALTPASFGART